MPTILVVDDDILVLRTLQKALKIKGYEVDTADSGVKAIEMASNKNYETILSDLCMPKMDGIETMVKIPGNTRKLYMTGYSKKYEDSGIKFLAKPFGIDELIRFISHEQN